MDRDPGGGGAGAGVGGRAVGGQPAHAELEGGADLAEGIEQGQGVAQRVGAGQALDRGRVDGVDGGEGLAALGGQRGAGGGPFGVTEDLARDRLALEALDHEPGAAQRIGVGVCVGGVEVGRRHDGGHGDAGPPGRIEEGSLEPRLRLSRRPAAAVHLQDQGAEAAARLEVERAGDPGGAARQPSQVAHGPAQGGTERRGQLVAAQAGGHR